MAPKSAALPAQGPLVLAAEGRGRGGCRPPDEFGDLSLDRVILPCAGRQEFKRFAPGDQGIDGFGGLRGSIGQGLETIEWTNRRHLGQVSRLGASSVSHAGNEALDQACAGAWSGGRPTLCGPVMTTLTLRFSLNASQSANADDRQPIGCEKPAMIGRAQHECEEQGDAEKKIGHCQGFLAY